MKIFTAPNIPEEMPDNAVTAFLAGGITGCDDWQKKTIEYLESYPNTDRLVVFNPRGAFFDSDYPLERDVYRQAKWEHYFLSRTHIFTMYFCEGKSQRLSMYELGKYFGIGTIENSKWFTFTRPIISTEKGFDKFYAILCRTALNLPNADDIIEKYNRDGTLPYYINNNATPESHARRIYREYCRAIGVNWEDKYAKTGNTI